MSLLQQQEISHEMAVTTNKTVSAIHLQPFHLWWPWCHSLIPMEVQWKHHEVQRLSSLMTWSSLEGARNLFVVDRPVCKSQKKKLLSAAPPNKASSLALSSLSSWVQAGITAWEILRAAFCFHLPLCAPDRDVIKLQQRLEATVMSALLGIRN